MNKASVKPRRRTEPPEQSQPAPSTYVGCGLFYCPLQIPPKFPAQLSDGSCCTARCAACQPKPFENHYTMFIQSFLWWLLLVVLAFFGLAQVAPQPADPWAFAAKLLLGIAAVCLILAGIGGLMAVRGRAGRKREEQQKRVLESRFPAARVTQLSNGNWLITDVPTGRTRCELTANGDVFERGGEPAQC